MIGQYREMFVTATSFLECVDYCFKAENSFVKVFHTPAIVN